MDNNTTNKKNILIADDNQGNCAIVQDILNSKYNILYASDGITAIKLLKQYDVSCVLLDLYMPIMDGFEVIREMRSDIRFTLIPIVVATSGENNSERKAFELGADDYITIPFDPYVLKKRIQNLIERYELQGMERLAKEQKRFRDLFDILNIAYWEWTKDSGYYHSEKYCEYAISTMDPDLMWDYKTPFKYVHPDDVENLKKFMQYHPDHEIRKSAIVRHLMKDGSYKWTEMFSITETDSNGILIRLVTILREVDKEWLDQKERLQKALTEAQAANKAKTAFLSRISHDMRTPLNGILGLASLIRENTSDRQTAEELGELESSGHYLLDLINDTLDVSRIESGKLELHPTICDSRTLFNNIISMAKISMQEKNIRFNIYVDDLPFKTLFVDSGRIQQVIMNIIGNACKFTPVGGTINLTMKNISIADGIITDEITVDDTGIGINADFLPQIFEAFAQEDGSNTSTSKGTGLGMTITKSILTQMGGDIAIESEVGKGTRVVFTIPLQIASDDQIAQWKKDKELKINDEILCGKRILLCEDHPLNSIIATKILKNKGMIVDHAENGKLGVEMFARSDIGYYNAILMDIRMPVMDGLTAARSIRELNREDSLNVPIIAVTANAFESDIQQAKEAGMNAHISKPIQTDLLYATLERSLFVTPVFKKPKILIVDDIQENRNTVRCSIEQEYDILEAANGKVALELMEKHHGIVAVITDIQMPVMDGIDLIKAIRKTDMYRHIAIIVNTQFGDTDQEEKLLAIGTNDFIYKPIAPKIVAVRVKNALEKYN